MKNILSLNKQIISARTAAINSNTGREKLGLANEIHEIRIEIDRVASDTLDPTNPTDYAKIMTDEALQLAYQDPLDAFFQERIVAIRNALLDLGWDNSRPDEISKGNHLAQFQFNHIGAGRNVVGMRIDLIDKTTNMSWDHEGWKDELTKTPEQLAAEIDAALPGVDVEPETEQTPEPEQQEQAGTIQANADANDEKPTQKAGIKQVIDVMPLIKQFIGKSQLSVIGLGIRGEEGQFFKDKLLEVARVIESMPKTYETDGQGNKAVAYLHYFKGGGDWYITEKDAGDVEDAKEGISGQVQAFGYADLGQGEMGYISIKELIEAGVELDLYWTPKTIGEIKGVDNNEGDPVIDPIPDVETKPVQEIKAPVTELDKQKQKLENLMALQEQMKSANKILKSKKFSDDEKKAKLIDLGYSEAEAVVLMRPDFAGRIGFTYQLSNNNGVISNTRKRIEELEAREIAEATSSERETTYEFEDGSIELNYSEDRLQVFFDSKPDSDMRAKLKSNGFKWSPTNSAWQRKLTDNAISTANYLFGTDIKTAASIARDEQEPSSGGGIVPPVVNEPTESQGNPMKTAFEAELRALQLETDIEAFNTRIDEIAGRIEQAGLMEEMDGLLNETADKLTELLAEAEK